MNKGPGMGMFPAAFMPGRNWWFRNEYGMAGGEAPLSQDLEAV